MSHFVCVSPPSPAFLLNVAIFMVTATIFCFYCQQTLMTNKAGKRNLLTLLRHLKSHSHADSLIGSRFGQFPGANRYWPSWSALVLTMLLSALAAPYAHLWKTTTTTTSQSVGHLGARFADCEWRLATNDCVENQLAAGKTN